MKKTVYARTIVYTTPLGFEIERGWDERTPKALKTGELEDVILLNGSHNGGAPMTNVPRVFTFSDYDNWGFSGTGPTCLAKNILHHFSNGNKALVDKFWDEFTMEVVARFPYENSGIIQKDAILNWIDEKTKPKAEVIPPK